MAILCKGRSLGEFWRFAGASGFIPEPLGRIGTQLDVPVPPRPPSLREVVVERRDRGVKFDLIGRPDCVPHAWQHPLGSVSPGQAGRLAPELDVPSNP